VERRSKAALLRQAVLRGGCGGMGLFAHCAPPLARSQSAQIHKLLL